MGYPGTCCHQDTKTPRYLDRYSHCENTPCRTNEAIPYCHPRPLPACRLPSPLRGGSEGGVGDPGFIGHRMHKNHKETWIVTAIAKTLPAEQTKQSPIVIPVLSLPAGFPLRCGEGVRVGLGIQGLLATECTKITRKLGSLQPLRKHSLPSSGSNPLYCHHFESLFFANLSAGSEVSLIRRVERVTILTHSTCQASQSSQCDRPLTLVTQKRSV